MPKYVHVSTWIHIYVCDLLYACMSGNYVCDKMRTQEVTINWTAHMGIQNKGSKKSAETTHSAPAAPTQAVSNSTWMYLVVPAVPQLPSRPHFGGDRGGGVH